MNEVGRFRQKWLRRAIWIGAAVLYGALSRNIPSGAARYLVQIFLYAALGEAWNLLSGFAGMTSLGQQLFIGLGGYAVAMVTTYLKVPFPVGLLAGALAAALAALLLSRLLFRLWGMYFSICTWVAAEAVQMLFLNWKAANQGAGLTIRIFPYPSIQQIHLMAFLVFALALAVVSWIMRSRLGLGLIAMREDPETASACGIRTDRSRLIIYVLSAALSAVAGGLFFINKGIVYPDSGFGISWTVSLVFICIIGGTGTILGPVVGSVIYVLLREYLAHFPGWSNMILGLITILAVLFLPGGISGLLARFLPERWFSFRRRPAGLTGSSDIPDPSAQ